MRAKARSHCPIAYALDAFGDRWTLLIVRDLMFKGKRKYVEFLEGEEGIATNVLVDRLVRLCREEIVEAQKDAADGRAKIYRLTRKGIDLAPLLIEMIVWSARHDGETAADKAFLRRARLDRESLLRDIERANCGRCI